jgi:uncharacterized membrane protein YkoI
MIRPATFLPRRLLVLGLLASALAVSTPLWADSDDHELARQALEQGQVLPLRTVLDQVERDYRGQVLKIEFEREDGRFVYEIRLLQDDGRLAKLEVDATTGEVLKIKRRGQRDH